MIEEERQAGSTERNERRIQGMAHPAIRALHAQPAAALCYGKGPKGPHDTRNCRQASAGEDYIPERRWESECVRRVAATDNEGDADGANGEQNPERTRPKDAKEGIHDYSGRLRRAAAERSAVSHARSALCCSALVCARHGSELTG